MQPCPAESTKRSRSGQAGSAGLWRRYRVQRTCAIGAAPIGRPGWPGFRLLDRVHRQGAEGVDCSWSMSSYGRDTEAAPDGLCTGGGTIATPYPIARTPIRTGRRGGEDAPRTRDTGGQRARQIGLGRDPVGVLGDVAPKRARDRRRMAERVQHPRPVGVHHELVLVGRAALPERHRPAGQRPQARAGRGARRGRARCGRARPGRRSRAPRRARVAGLVVPDQRVEPLVRHLVRRGPGDPGPRRGRSASGTRSRCDRDPARPRGEATATGRARSGAAERLERAPGPAGRPRRPDAWIAVLDRRGDSHGPRGVGRDREGVEPAGGDREVAHGGRGVPPGPGRSARSSSTSSPAGAVHVHVEVGRRRGRASRPEAASAGRCPSRRRAPTRAPGRTSRGGRASPERESRSRTGPGSAQAKGHVDGDRRPGRERCGRAGRRAWSDRGRLAARRDPADATGPASRCAPSAAWSGPFGHRRKTSRRGREVGREASRARVPVTSPRGRDARPSSR